LLDIPKFKTRPKPSRYLITKIIVLFFLGILLYIGIYVNYWVVGSAIPEILNGIFIAGIIMLLALEIILCYVKYSQYYYLFYNQRVELRELKVSSIDYSRIVKLSFDDNLIDKWFKTSTIILQLDDTSNKMIKIRHITNGNQIYFFLQKAGHRY
jgi:hypothetical protein